MSSLTCPYSRRCGGCQLLAMSYEEELAHKQELARRHLSRFGKLLPILGAANPCYYRNKVEAAFGLDRSRKVIAGTYEPRSHRIVDINSCLNEDKNATAIIVTIKKLLPSFRLAPYDEDARTGFLRHVLVRRGIHTGEVMVVLVTASPVFPSRQNFLKALLTAHPEITTIVQNVNNRRTSVLLGDREQTLYGPGFIRDTLCGMSFRISPRSFYQINPTQTEVLYRRAIKAAGLTGKERVLDAYCGIGTIGMIAAADAREVIGVEQNPAAVRDAIRNAKENGVENIRFVAADATEWMQAAAAEKLSIDILLMDPPRSGSTPEFLSAAVKWPPAASSTSAAARRPKPATWPCCKRAATVSPSSSRWICFLTPSTSKISPCWSAEAHGKPLSLSQRETASMTGPSPAGIYPNEPIRQIVRIKNIITRPCVLAGGAPAAAV